MKTRRYSTKKQLIEEYNLDVRDGVVWHRSDNGQWHQLKEVDIFTPHPYGVGKLYKGYSFWHNKKSYVCPVSIFNYIWYKGDIPDGMEVDHINNNTLDNSLDNLQLLSHRDNIDKRMNGGSNQFSAVDKLLKSIPQELNDLDTFNPNQLKVCKLEADMARLEYLTLKLRNQKRKVMFLKLKEHYNKVMESL